MQKRIALVDADGILYAAALKGETVCDGTQLQLLSLDRIFQDARDRLEQQIRWVRADDAFVCLSDRRSFRMDLLASYKGQRKGSPRPLALDALRARFADDSPYRVLLIKNLEADDVCGISQGRLQEAGSEPIIVSPDKDMLQIPGLVCTPTRDGSHPIAEITKEAGDDWHITQTLTGDVVDNYKGCPGWGARKAGNFHDLAKLGDLSLADKLRQVRVEYGKAGLTDADCLVQAQVSRILRVGDWDPVHKEPKLFQFPANRLEQMAA